MALINACMYLLLIAIVSGCKFDVKEDDETVVIFSGELRIELTKVYYRMVVYDNSSGEVIISERQDDAHRLSYGTWKGRYYDVYYGYLFRLGEVSHWYRVTNIISVHRSDTDVTIDLATTNKKQTMKLRLHDFRRRQFSFSYTMPDASVDRIRWTIDLSDRPEKLYGYGERFDSLDQKYNKLGCWSEDGSWSIGRIFPDARFPGGWTSTYAPMPLYFSSLGYGFMMDTTFRTEFDSSLEIYNQVTVETNVFAATLFAGRNVRETFGMMMEANGKSLIPPKWAFGPWNQLNREEYGVNATDRAEEMLKKDDIPFSMNINAVQFFPDGEDINQRPRLLSANKKLLSMGIPSTAYFNPMVDISFNDTYNDAASHGFFTKNQTGDPYQFVYIGSKLFKVSQVDFTNPKAVAWYQDHLQLSLDLQYKGWMHDSGEFTPHDSINFLNQTGLESHNEYPLLYQKAAFDFLTANNTPGSPYAPDYLYYVRSGYTGSQKYTWAHWTGDPSSDWTDGSGLVANLMASLTVGLSGMPFSGSDIGGFEWYLEKPPSLELWVRWTQLGCFSGLMHEQGGGKGTGNKTHIFDTPAGTLLWRKFAKLRTQLFPYIYTQAHIAHYTGLPIMRAHVLDFYDDFTALNHEEQYMFGESILVAPIYLEDTYERDVYLPEACRWIDISSNLTYDEEDGRFRIHQSDSLPGNIITAVHAPLDTIPLFVREGTILPAFDPSVQVLSPSPDPKVTSYDEVKILHLWAWPDLEGRSFGVDWQNNTFGTSHLLPKEGKGLLISLNVTSPNYDTVICQIAINNNSRVHQVKESSGGQLLTKVDTWKDVVHGSTMTVWSIDTILKTLWVKVTSKPVQLDALFS